VEPKSEAPNQGHTGHRRAGPDRIDHQEEHQLSACPKCHGPNLRIQPLAFLCFLRFLLFRDESATTRPLFAKADWLYCVAIGAATFLQRLVGPGLLESTNERCLVYLVDGILRLVLPHANKARTEGNEGNEV
jgi:hypothetical protein